MSKINELIRISAELKDYIYGQLNHDEDYEEDLEVLKAAWSDLQWTIEKHTLKAGDKVMFNTKYEVSDKNKDKVFSVQFGPQLVSGTPSVWLDGLSGCYALDGLKKVEE
jgi:hypothetical protein